MQAQISRLLQATTGLNLTSISPSIVERAVRRRMENCTTTCIEDYWQHLERTTGELDALIDEVVIPETSFFRNREPFHALSSYLTEEWLQAHPLGKLRLLSVPCSTGEEPYSIAMTLLDARMHPGGVCIDAVDISTRALTSARTAIYGDHSFRGKELQFRSRYFRSTEAGYVLDESVRNMVHFTRGNLLDPRFLSDKAPYDVVFCRNLLIYFDRPTQQLAFTALEHLVRPGGLLFLGHAETILASQEVFVPFAQAGAFAFRKVLPRPALTGLRSSVPVAAPRPATAQKTAVPMGLPLPSRTAGSLEEAHRLADSGHLDAASVLCRNYLEVHGPCARAYFLLGLVQDAEGNAARAEEWFRKALYLDPEHLESLVHLALQVEHRGDTATAQRLRGRAERAEKRRSTGAGR
ncbi:MAG: hypothetical protein H7Y22_18100 [Gemmatimonadaceae bacterium]|nr:hypothetical protein [Gloeobacterales cyanobacterium ES-bin-141]